MRAMARQSLLQACSMLSLVIIATALPSDRHRGHARRQAIASVALPPSITLDGATPAATMPSVALPSSSGGLVLSGNGTAAPDFMHSNVVGGLSGGQIIGIITGIIGLAGMSYLTIKCGVCASCCNSTTIYMLPHYDKSGEGGQGGSGAGCCGCRGGRGRKDRGYSSNGAYAMRPPLSGRNGTGSSSKLNVPPPPYRKSGFSPRSSVNSEDDDGGRFARSGKSTVARSDAAMSVRVS